MTLIRFFFLKEFPVGKFQLSPCHFIWRKKQLLFEISHHEPLLRQFVDCNPLHLLFLLKSLRVFTRSSMRHDTTESVFLPVPSAHNAPLIPITHPAEFRLPIEYLLRSPYDQQQQAPKYVFSGRTEVPTW